MAISKVELLGFRPRVESVEVEGLGEPVYIREMSVAEAFAISDLENDALVATALLYGLSDDTGQRIFEDEELEAIRGLPVASAMDLFKKVMAFNGQDAEVQEKKLSADLNHSSTG